MEVLWPGSHEEALDEVYADLAERPTPWVAIGMVQSLDGAATLSGVSGGLGGDGDRAAFRALRTASDVILVGAGTVRAERYGPPRPRPHEITRRRERGQTERPAIAVVSASLDLGGGERLFDEDPTWRPLIITVSDADERRQAQLRARGADVVHVGEGRVDLDLAVAALHERGLVRVLVEGGPHLNGELLAAGLVDDLFVTVAPTAIGGGSTPRIMAGPEDTPVSLQLAGVRRHGDELLLHYHVAR